MLNICSRQEVVTGKIKHLQNVLEPSTSCRSKNVEKHFYFACNYRLSSTCAQHANTFAKHLQKCFKAVYFPRLRCECKNV